MPAEQRCHRHRRAAAASASREGGLHNVGEHGGKLRLLRRQLLDRAEQARRHVVRFRQPIAQGVVGQGAPANVARSLCGVTYTLMNLIMMTSSLSTLDSTFTATGTQTWPNCS